MGVEELNESEPMMKPRKEARRCRKQVATFVSASKVYRKPDYWVHGNRGKIGRTSTQALLRNKRNLFRICKIERGNKQHGCG